MIKLASTASTESIQESTQAQGEPEASQSGFASIGIDSTFLVAQIINFFILFFVLKALLYKPVLKLLNDRTAKIEQGLKLAQDNEARARALEEQSKKIVTEAKEEAKKILSESEKIAKEIASQLKQAAQSESEAILTRTKEAMEREKAGVVAQAQGELAGLVLKATQQILETKEVGINEQDIKNSLKAFEEPREAE